MISSRFTYSLLFIITTCLTAATGGNDDEDQARCPTNRIDDNPLINDQERFEEFFGFFEVGPKGQEAVLNIMPDVAESDGDIVASIERLKNQPSFKNLKGVLASIMLKLLTNDGDSTSASVSMPRNQPEHDDQDDESAPHSTQDIQDLPTQSENTGTKDEQNQFDKRTSSNKSKKRFEFQHETVITRSQTKEYTWFTKGQPGRGKDDRAKPESERADKDKTEDDKGLEVRMPQIQRLNLGSNAKQQFNREDEVSDSSVDRQLDLEDNESIPYRTIHQIRRSPPLSLDINAPEQRDESPVHSRKSSVSAKSVHNEEFDRSEETEDDKGLEVRMPQIQRLNLGSNAKQQFNREDEVSDSSVDRQLDLEDNESIPYRTIHQIRRSPPLSLDINAPEQRDESPVHSRKSSVSAKSVHNEEYDEILQIDSKCVKTSTLNTRSLRVSSKDLQNIDWENTPSTDTTEMSDSESLVDSPERKIIARKLLSFNTQPESVPTNSLVHEGDSESQEYHDACSENHESESSSVVGIVKLKKANKSEVERVVHGADPTAEFIVPNGRSQKQAREFFMGLHS